MIKDNTLYEFCKNYTDKFEEAEIETMDKMRAMLEEGHTEEEIREKIYESGEMDIIFNKVDIPKAGLQALIVDDFVKELPESLQSKIMMHCMESMYGEK